MFYRESDCKQTPIGNVPRDWKTVKLGDAVERVRDSLDPRNYPDEVFELYSIPAYHTTGKPEHQFGKEIKSLKLVIDDHMVLFGKINPRLPKVWLVSSKSKFRKIASTEFIALRTISDLSPNFLYYLCFSKYLLKKSMALVTGSTPSRMRTDEKAFLKLLIPIPSSSEQQALVDILSVVDLAIAKAGEVIAKTERLKKGLMQELLTKGIGHKEYKQTPIGNTPNTWKTVKLRDVAEIRGNKSMNNFEEISFIPMDLISETGIFAKYQTRAREDVRSSTYCEAGDLLLAKITPSLENGKQGIVPSDVPNKIALATTEVFPICCKGINKLFLYYVLKFSKFRDKIISSMIGTTGRQRASKEGVERLEIPLPPFDEQQRIVEILSIVDKKLELEISEKTRLERIKRGLMDLLLTGKVRVKVD